MIDEGVVFERLIGLFLARLDLAVSGPDVELLSTGLVDSLAFVTLLLALEEEFDIQISVDDLEIDDFRTVRHIAAFLSRSVSASDLAGHAVQQGQADSGGG